MKNNTKSGSESEQVEVILGTVHTHTGGLLFSCALACD